MRSTGIVDTEPDSTADSGTCTPCSATTAGSLRLPELVGGEGDPHVVVAAGDGLGQEREARDVDLGRAMEVTLRRQLLGDPVLGDADRDPVGEHGEAEEQQHADGERPHSRDSRARATGAHAASGSTAWMTDSVHGDSDGSACAAGPSSVAPVASTTT